MTNFETSTFKSHFLRKSGKISIFEEVTLFKFAHYLFVGEDSCTKGKTINSFEKIHFVFEILTPKVLVILRIFPFFIFHATLELNYRQQHRKNTNIYIWIGSFDGSPQSFLPYLVSWDITLQNLSKTIFVNI